MQSPIQAYLVALHDRLASAQQGELASYIPQLAKADPQSFGICIVTTDGVAYAVGDTDRDVHDPVDIQAVRLRHGPGGSRA